ncbi:MAG: insulinase family protein [Bdellovibrionaceae bacterium]|nr:insulinase family protein [Pseudobdellovibrionaceae bacterium]
MRMNQVFAGFLICGLVVGAGCSSSMKGSGSSWFGGSSFKVQAYETKTLPNGLTLIYVKDESLPKVEIQAMVKTGLRQEAKEKAGLNSLVASLLSQGTSTRSAVQISDAFNALGTEFSASAGVDAVVANADALSSDADALLALFADVLMKPTFATAEVNRLKSQRIAALKRRIDNPGNYSRRKFSEFLFSGTSYSRDTAGEVETIQALRQTDVIKHYLANYRPNNTIVAVTGRFDAAFAKKVEDVMGAWTSREIKPPAAEQFPVTETLSVKLVSKKGLAQAQVLLGRPMIPRTHADYLALRVANEALGGGFGARLMQRIRDDLGLTYSVYSSLGSNQETGYFQIATFTKNPSTGQTLKEVLKVYETFINEGITDKELASAKAQIVGQYPRGLETADSVASTLMSLNLLGLPLSEIEAYPGRIEKLSLKEVNEAIRRHFKVGALKALVYADRAAVGTQIQEFSPIVETAR